MIKLNINELQELIYAVDDVVGYLADNSCSDPDCCGGPFFTVEQYDEGLETLLKFGIELDEDGHRDS